MKEYLSGYCHKHIINLYLHKNQTNTTLNKQLSLKTRFFNIFRYFFTLPPLEKYLTTYTKGKSVFAFVSKFVPNNYQYPKPSIRQVQRNDIQYFLDINDFVDWHIYFGFKDVAKEKLYALLQKNNVVIDVGVNVGEVSLNCAKVVGKNGRVIGFEPHPNNFARCQKNIQLNSFSNIQIYNKGLGNEHTHLTMQAVDASNAGKNRITHQTSNKKGTIIEVITLDDFVNQQAAHLLHIHLIKIDVEGFEMKVLQGAKQTLQNYQPILVIELDDNNLREQQSSASELVAFLEELNYHIVNAETEKVMHSGDDFTACHIDIIARR